MTMNFEKHVVSLTLLSLLLTRILVVGATIGDSIAFLALAGFAGYSLYLQNRNRDFEKSQIEKLEIIQTEVREQKLNLETMLVDKQDSMQSELNALRQQVGLIKIDQGFQQTNKSSNNANIKGTSSEKKKYF